MATPRRKVVVARNLGPDVMSLLNDHPELEVIAWPHENKPCDRKWLLENIPGAYGVLVMYFDKVDVELLEAAGSSLRAVSTFSVGYEHINVPELVKRGIKLGYTPDVLTDSMADMSIMLALMAGRNVKQTHEIVNTGQWPAFVWSPFGFCGPQISANPVNPKPTAGFIGFGRIAHATLARLIPFGFARCLYTGNPATPPNAAADAKVAEKYGVKEVRRTDLSELARESDVVFALAPGGPSTFHIIDEAFLKQMKKTAVLVNTGRGTLIDSDALAKALQEGWLYGAGLDVVEGEPGITQDHPLVKSPRCIILPHVGSATTETRLQMGTLAANNLINGVLGTPMPVELNTSH